MADLYFPTGDEKLDYDSTLDPINPWNYNGVKYVWNNEKQTWDIYAESEVTQDYVDYYDSFRVSRSGDTMGGNLDIKTGLDESAESMVHLGYKRTDTSYKSFLTFGGAFSEITLPRTGNRTLIKLGDSLKFAEIDPNFLYFYKTVKVDTRTASATFLTQMGGGEYTLFKVQSSPATEVISCGITLASTYKSKFAITNGSGTPLFAMGGTGVAHFRSNQPNAFVVRRESDPYMSNENLGSSDKGVLFRINPKNFKMFAATEYNEALKKGTHTVQTPNGESITETYDDERLLLTWGAFQHHKIRQGSSIIASSEDEAEVGGLWTNGTAIYIKLKA